MISLLFTLRKAGPDKEVPAHRSAGLFLLYRTWDYDTYSSGPCISSGWPVFVQSVPEL